MHLGTAMLIVMLIQIPEKQWRIHFLLATAQRILIQIKRLLGQNSIVVT